MTEEQFEKLRYPIGKFAPPDKYSKDSFLHCIKEIKNFPAKLSEQVTHLTEEQLQTPYRPDGWTIRQVVHHCADSHMNGLIRFKVTLTEDKPTIKPYRENLVAELADTKVLTIEPSLLILKGVHERWVALLESLNENHLQMKYIHPEYNKEFSLNEAGALYAWHGNHHLAHITTLKKNKNWL
ncbi:MAG: metal-dependent hydrolase [Bacteroidetes bacterium]|nr:metal-dependent hydrolase [Bacteroidota bacterium]